ncbi:hypothetical protein T4B_9350 [Trichinella pseudospiralis]|uniref:Uncharacterized protein n=1 Tax=Trichinella pseudospiralis TaxID=6337 RepID=A0A0V1G9K9_TRIPS|nr:hypothetical protein T4B_9350 [Trichinella pseudospiralis]KRY96154.1 hypothetical protein T4C_789 [Trichinella pseudospiralis]
MTLMLALSFYEKICLRYTACYQYWSFKKNIPKAI